MKNKYQRMIHIMRQILKKMHVPLFLHPKSKHTFSVHQHIIMLVLRQYESKSYESFVEWLQVSTEIMQMLDINTIPHFTTLQKAAARLSEILLHVAIGRFIQIVSPGMIFAGVDATGFEDNHRTPYYSYRCSLRHSYTKMSAGSDMKTQIICVVMIQHHPVSHDIKHFPEILRQMTLICDLWIMVLDKGYDAESVHQLIRKNNVLSMIPTRNRDCLISRTRGRYRKLMRREFDDALYHQRNKCETIFSVIKRRFGSEIKSHNNAMKEKELLYRVLAYNCHRMCMISALLWMISREPQMNHMQTMMSGMGGMSGMGSMSGMSGMSGGMGGMSGMGSMSGMSGMSGGMGGMSGMGSMSGMSRHGAFLVPGSVHQLCHQDSTMSPAYCEPHYQVMSSIPGVRISHIHPVDNTTLEVTLTTTNSAKSTINQGTTVFVGNDYLFGSANVPSGWKDKTTVNVPLKGMGIVYDYESMHGHLLATTGTSMDNMAHP